MNATLHTIPTAPKSKAKGKAKVRTTRADRRWQSAAAAGIGLVALALTTLSLTHLAHGIHVVTLAPTWEAWAMAIGIDLGFIACEVAQLCVVAEAAKKAVAKFAKPAIVGTLAASAAMNAFAFAAVVGGWMVYPAIALGIAIPALIYALTRIGMAMWK